MPHVIRLRAAWWRGLELGTPDGPRVSLPDESSPSPAPARLCYWRSFNCPSGIDRETPLAIVIEAWSGILAVRMDQDWLVEQIAASAVPLEIDITGRLDASHQLEIHLSSDAHAAPTLRSAVQLVIGDT